MSPAKQMMPTWVLRMLVKCNFRLREAHLLPDEWYWADLELFTRIGMCV